MLSKADTKYINSLQNKKYRKIEHAFLVEGHKNVVELLSSDYETLRIFSTEPYLHALQKLSLPKGIVPELVTEKELASLGTLENNHTSLAIARTKQITLDPTALLNGLVLALDGINDPGNLGTIIRIADWYGISHILCSPDTVDVYNPKVINASKGSFARVGMIYTALDQLFASLKGVHIYAASMEGTSLYQSKWETPSVLLLGNEANGVSKELMAYANHRVNIPRIGKAESLNVGVAAAIIVDRMLGGK